jgi:hypothetical protein
MQGAPSTSWFERACRTAAFFVPFGVALAHVASSPVWRDDLALLRGLAWVGNGRTGGVSAIVVQASFFVPLGSLYFRAGLAMAVVLGLAGLAIFSTTRALLERGADTPRLSAAVSAIAAFLATLGATGQREGTVAGGAAVALLGGALVFAANPADALRERRRALALGLVLGALAGESGAVALAVTVGILVQLAVLRARPRRDEVFWALGGACASLLFVLAPLYIRPRAPGSFLDLGPSIAALGPLLSEGPPHALGGVGAMRDEVGRVALGLAGVGAAIGLARARYRGSVAPIVAVVLLDLLASWRETSLLSNEVLAPLHLVALALLCALVAVALQAAFVTMLDMQLALARQATLFFVMGALALATANAEEASFIADRSVLRGAEAFSDEAVERLAPGAAVLVRSRAAAHRLWAARAIDGSRPDLLVVPVPILGDTRVTLTLLRAEPALKQILRDVSLDGRPGEEALTILADARPALAELDPRWDRRVVSHLVADHFWLGFAPEPLGQSDRKAAFADLRSRFARVLAASTIDDRIEPMTAAVVRARLTDAAAEAAFLGDRDEAVALLGELGKVSSGDRFVTELTQRLAATKSGPVDIKGLLW